MHWDDDDGMMCISLFSYGRPVVVRCIGVRLGMGSVGSWVHKFTWQWVGLGQLFDGLGWVGSMKIDPRTTLVGSTGGSGWLRMCGRRATANVIILVTVIITKYENKTVEQGSMPPACRKW